EVLVTTDARENFLFAAHVTLNVGDRVAWIEHRENRFQCDDRFQGANQLVFGKVNQRRFLTVDEGGRAERCPPRVREVGGVEAEIGEQTRQSFVVDQTIHG